MTIPRTVLLLLGAALLPPSAHGQDGDPRVGLEGGWLDAGEAAWNVEHLAFRPRPEGFFNPSAPGDFGFINTDLAFRGEHAFVGSYNGFQVWDIAEPTNPRLRSTVVCPGGQGDLSIYGNLLFMSVEETRARVDCGTRGVQGFASPDRFRGVRIFDVSDLDQPRQVAAVQTCRGSHTHTLVPAANDDRTVYVYVSGTGPVRSGEELEGCSAEHWSDDPNTAYWRIEVIEVPLGAPHEARVVNTPRVFSDPRTGNIGALWEGGDHGPGTQNTAQTNQCHDVTAYPAIGLAAGACSGNGILLDISDPVNPVRLDEVADENFAYWHSATFNNDGTRVLFTDEWGGGVEARCQVGDPREWGANAVFDVVDGRLEFGGYYKLPAAQSPIENCVAHNGSIIPVPGRDIKVQAWYQGGLSVFDFTDPANPVEIAFFDRGPLSETQLALGGYWSAYWYNGEIYASEIGRGLDVFRLTPSEHLSQNEIDAAALVEFDDFNPQMQPRLEWPAAFVVARAHLDQLARSGAVAAARLAAVGAELNRLEGLPAGEPKRAGLAALAAGLEEDARGAATLPSGTSHRLRMMADAVRALR